MAHDTPTPSSPDAPQQDEAPPSSFHAPSSPSASSPPPSAPPSTLTTAAPTSPSASAIYNNQRVQTATPCAYNEALTAANGDGEDMDVDPEVAFRVKWGGSLYAVELPLESTIADLKRRLFELTEVQPKRQKVIGLPSTGSRLPDDTLMLNSLNLKPDQGIMLFGSREADISAANAAYLTVEADIVNDLDVDYDPEDGSRRTLRDEATYRRRLERRIETTEVRIMNQPRLGKRLLVLDLDYTLFDCRSSAPTISRLGRPGLHAFLASAYRWYDIVVWSQTSWRWLEAKLTGLSMLFSEGYKLCFVLDRTSMFSVTSKKHGQERTHEVKALEIIWRKFPGRWGPHNTVHIDDLSKNFALNPQSGLKIAPFKNANVTRETDRELFRLEHYLKLIAEREPDFTKLKHKNWNRYRAMYPPSPPPQSNGSPSNEDPPPRPPQ